MNREEKAQYCIDNPKKSPAFQFYPDNWWGSRHVTVMDAEQRGIHASLIFSSWLEPNCGIPENEICLSARIPENKKAIAFKVLECCWFLYSGFWFCERLLNERIKQTKLSNKRSCAGKKGGRPQKSKIYKNKAIDNQLQKNDKAKKSKSEDEDEDEDEDIIVNNNSEIPEEKERLAPEWKNRCSSFEEYQKWELEEYEKIIHNASWIYGRVEFHNRLNIILTIKKAHLDYWSTKEGWKKIKSRRGETVDWTATWTNALTMKCNQVWLNENEINEIPGEEDSFENWKQEYLAEEEERKRNANLKN